MLVSTQFAVLAAAVIVLYNLIPTRYRWLVLLAGGAYFCHSFGWTGLVFLAGSTLADYWLARLIDASPTPRRRLFLALSLLLNLGGLVLFKYVGPALGSLPLLGGRYFPGAPIGLSFFTFAKLAYVSDVYRRKIPAETHLGYWATFVSFFPNLAAGPIERAGHLLPQLKAAPGFDPVRITAGLRRILWGVFKKVVVADRLAQYVDAVYNAPWANSGQALLLATFFLAFQIYADFAAYTDIALGVAQVLGFELFENFRRPYFATSPLDFWRRWHMSLTNWIREYLLFPLARWLLGVTRRRLSPTLVQAIAYLFVMALVGLWHGTGWTFVAWGLLHGLFLAVESALPSRLRQPPQSRWERLARVLVTFGLGSAAWVLFRANSFTEARFIYSHLLAFGGDFWQRLADPLPLDPALTALFQVLRLPPVSFTAQRLAQIALTVALVGLLVVADVLEARGSLARRVALAPAWARWSLYYAGSAAIAWLGVWGLQEFIYFRF